jgi:hypothetical protein
MVMMLVEYVDTQSVSSQTKKKREIVYRFFFDFLRMSVARRRERYLSQYLSDTTNERTSVRMRREWEGRKRERASERASKQAKRNKYANAEV